MTSPTVVTTFATAPAVARFVAGERLVDEDAAAGASLVLLAAARLGVAGVGEGVVAALAT